jgi:hypothetical protein
MRKFITYLIQAIGTLGVLASVPLYFFGSWSVDYLSTGGVKPASYTTFETIWQVSSYYLFFIILIVAGWYFRRKK